MTCEVCTLMGAFSWVQQPARIPHAPHQRANDQCHQDECIGWQHELLTDRDDYGKRIFGLWLVDKVERS